MVENFEAVDLDQAWIVPQAGMVCGHRDYADHSFILPLPGSHILPMDALPSQNQPLSAHM